MNAPEQGGVLFGPFDAPETEATPGQAARNLADEEVTREFTGWAEAQGYDDSELYSLAEMDEAFAAGMQAARDLAAQERTAPEMDLASDEMRPGELDSTLATVPPCEEISSWGLRCRVIRAHETHRDRDGNMWQERTAPGDDELARALASMAAERNQYRIALERIADGSRNRDGMMGCASRALAEPASELPHVDALIAALTKKINEAEADRDDYAARLKGADQSWTRLAAERDALRERLAEVLASAVVTAAERDDLARALDKRNAQHKQLLDGFRYSLGGQVQRLSAVALARAYRDAGYPARDDLPPVAKP